MEKIFHFGVVLAAGAAMVYAVSKSQLSAQGTPLVEDDIEEVPHREPTEEEQDEEEVDMLTTYWAGSIPEDCEEVLDMLRFPEVYASYGSKMPRGLLLYGEPGTGKTYFGKMLADLANAHFFYAAASQMDEIYVGSGPKKLEPSLRRRNEPLKMARPRATVAEKVCFPSFLQMMSLILVMWIRWK